LKEVFPQTPFQELLLAENFVFGRKRSWFPAWYFVVRIGWEAIPNPIPAKSGAFGHTKVFEDR